MVFLCQISYPNPNRHARKGLLQISQTFIELFVFVISSPVYSLSGSLNTKKSIKIGFTEILFVSNTRSELRPHYAFTAGESFWTLGSHFTHF